jgi:hypothetical protein
MFSCRQLVVKSQISQQLEAWFCPPLRNHYNRSHVGMEQFTPQIVAQKLYQMAHLAKFSGTSVDISFEMGTPDSSNPPPLEN